MNVDGPSSSDSLRRSSLRPARRRAFAQSTEALRRAYAPHAASPALAARGADNACCARTVERPAAASVLDRVARVVSLVSAGPNAGSGATLEASFGIGAGETVRLALRAQAAGVEITIVAPPAVAATLAGDRGRLIARLGARGIAVRSVRITSRAPRRPGERREREL